MKPEDLVAGEIYVNGDGEQYRYIEQWDNTYPLRMLMA